MKSVATVDFAKRTVTTILAEKTDLSLSEMLHVLDVARTLRRDQEIVESELNKEKLLASLRERLLAAAAAAGDNVTEAEVDAAIAIYFDSLHQYADPPLSLSLVLAHAYVLRKQIFMGLGVAAGAILLGWLFFWSPSAPYSSESLQRRTAEQQAQAVESAIETYARRLAASRSIAEQPSAIEQLDRFSREGDAAQATRNVTELERLTSAITALESRLREAYEVRIIADSDRMSGVIRDFEDRLSGYYLVVEAHAPDGRLLPIEITNRETQQKQRVSVWGELVPEAVFERIRADKQTDGVLDETLFAVKRIGWLDLDVVLPDDDGRPLERQGQITEW